MENESVFTKADAPSWLDGWDQSDGQMMLNVSLVF